MAVSDYSCRNSGQIHVQQHQIPAFGDWDKAKDLPITQYFESARQAGLIRYSSSSGESGPCLPPSDLYTVDRKKPPSSAAAAAPRKGRVREKRYPHVGLKDHHHNNNQIPIKKQQQVKVLEVTDPKGARKVKQNDMSLPRPPPLTSSNPIARPRPKPVDEDLYKIPPQLLHSSKRNKMKGLFSRCLVPACN